MPEQASVRLCDAYGIINPVTGGVGQAVDGETVAVGDEVLLINPPNGDAYAGPYVAAVGAWARRGDWDTVAEIEPYDWWNVREGGEFEGTKWQYEDTEAPTTLNVDLLTIGLWGRRRALEEGDGINIEGTTPPLINWEDPSELNLSFIEGLKLEYVSATSVRIKAGACVLPTGSVINTTSDITLSGLTLTASTLYYIYGYDVGGGVLGVDPPSLQRPATAYRGNARAKGGGTGGALDNANPDTEPDLTRRHIGTIYASATNVVQRFIVHPDDFVQYITDYEAGNTIISTGTSNTSNATRTASTVPLTTHEALIHYFPGAGAPGAIAYADTGGDLFLFSGATRSQVRVPLSATQTFLQRNTSAGGNSILSVVGYWEAH